MKNQNEKPNPLVAMVSRPMEDLRVTNYTCNDLRVDIARLVDRNGQTYPGNWSYEYNEPKTSTGGCFARIFATEATSYRGPLSLFGWYGPELNYGKLEEYQHGARAMDRIEKNLEKIREVRGGTEDAAELMGRFVEACGVTEVWVAKAKSDWLDEGKWDRLQIGRFVHEVRARLIETTTQAAAELAKAQAEKDAIATA